MRDAKSINRVHGFISPSSLPIDQWQYHEELFWFKKSL